MPITNVINNLSYVAISIASGVLAIQGFISIGMISSFLLYSWQFFRPFVDIANIYNNFQTAVAGAERILDIFDQKPEPQDMINAILLHTLGDCKSRKSTKTEKRAKEKEAVKREYRYL